MDIGLFRAHLLCHMIDGYAIALPILQVASLSYRFYRQHKNDNCCHAGGNTEKC